MKRSLLPIENTLNQMVVLTEEEKALIFEKAKANDYQTIVSMTGLMTMYGGDFGYLIYGNKIEVTEQMISEYIEFINPNRGKNKVEIMLCEQNTPTEVIGIISHLTNLAASCQNFNQCTDLLLKNYFYFNIYILKKNFPSFDSLFKTFPNQTHYTFDAADSGKFEDAIINNIKFLCDVIVNNFPQATIIQPLATFIRQYYSNSEVMKEMQPFLDFASSLVEKGKDNAATPSKPKCG
jgi:hypothetical protein